MKRTITLTTILVAIMLIGLSGKNQLKAIENCEIDSIHLNKLVYHLNFDTIYVDIDYCGSACGCNEIAYINFLKGEKGVDMDSLENHSPNQYQRINDNRIRKLIVLNDNWLRYGKYQLVIRDNQGKAFDIPEKHVVIGPGEEFTVRADSLISGCTGKSGYVQLSDWWKDKYDSLTTTWYRNGEKVKEGKWTGVFIDSLSESTAGNYHCIISIDGVNIDTTDTFTIPYNEVRVPGKPAGPVSLCHNDDEVIYSTGSLSPGKTYKWKVLPDGSGILEDDSNKVTITWNDEFSGEALLSVKEKSGECISEFSEPLSVFVAPQPETPGISVVTVNDTLNHNEIVWDYEVTPAIDSFGVYRETNVSDEYALIGTVMPDEPFEFLDKQSVPTKQANRYKISVFDTCGAESQLSPMHKTMHLTINAGINNTWNLIWDGYEGMSFSTYRILRGSDDDEMELLTEIASNLSSYTDLNPLPNTAYYQLEIVKNIQLKSNSLKAANQIVSRSNVVSTEAFSIDNELSHNKLIIRQDFENKTIRVSNVKEPFNIAIYNINGKLVDRITGIQPGKNIDVSMLESGIYFFRISNGMVNEVHKVVLE